MANAELKNIYGSAAINQFYYTTYATTEIHTSLPGQLLQNMQGLDEPGEFNLAYQVSFDTMYTGFTTIQSTGSNETDNDFYRFEMKKQALVSVKIHKANATDLAIQLYDAQYNKIGSEVHSDNLTDLGFIQELSPGEYYIGFSKTPDNSSYLYPYQFILNEQKQVGITKDEKIRLWIYPNPVSMVLNINSEIAFEEALVEIINGTGEVMIKEAYAQSIDVSKLSNGIYYLKIISKNSGTQNFRFMKEF